MPVHPTTIVDKNAEIDPTAEVGPYAIIEAGVKIGPRTRIYPHAFIGAGTTIGRGCAIHPFAVVGHHPQDLAWDHSPSYTTIGDETIIREGAQVHRGTIPESTTVIGKRVYMMANSHVGHNCTIGDDVKLVNGVLLSGHVEVGEKAFISGNVMIQQFSRIGELVMLSGGIRIPNDVVPYMTVRPEGVVGPNVVGLRRAGFNSEQREEIRAVYKLLFRADALFSEAVEQAAALVRTDPGRRMVEFLRGPSKRGFMRFRGDGSDESDLAE